MRRPVAVLRNSGFLFGDWVSHVAWYMIESRSWVRVDHVFRILLTECIYHLVLENQIPHKIVNLLFTITD